MKASIESCDGSISTILGDASLKKTKDGHELKEPLWKCRYVVILIGIFIHFYLQYIRLNMSINMVSMVNNTAFNQERKGESKSCPRPIKNITEDEISIKMEGEFHWSPKTQGYIQGIYYFGYLIVQVPTGLLAERYGGKWLLFMASFVTGICTLMIPVFSYLSVIGLMVLQALRGLAQGIVRPAIIVLAANWCPKTERGFLFSLMLTGGPVGSTLGSIFSGYISESGGGWTTSFCVTGAWGILLAVSILFFIVESPQVHPRISKAELDFILSNQENVLSKRRPKLPWCEILKSAPIYALTYAVVGQMWAVTQFWTVYSTFLATILHYPIGETGVLSALPFIMQFLVSQISTWISLYMQKKEIAGVNFLRKFWQSIGCLGISLCVLGMYFSGCNRTPSVIFAVLTTGCCGFGFAGCWIVPPDMSPRFAGTIYAITSSLGFLTSCFVPVVTGYLTNETQTIEQWNKIFFITIGIIMSSGIIFVIFGSAEVQPWNFVEEDTSENDKRHSKNVKENAQSDNYEKQTRF